jgi:hypothetical protein
MPERERKHIRLEDGRKNVLHAIWSRSGGLRVHIASSLSREGASEATIELTSDQKKQLARFLHDGP